MMSAKLRLNAYLPHANKPSVFELNNVNLKQSVQVLKKEVNKKVNLEQNKYGMKNQLISKQNYTKLKIFF